MTSVLFVCLGNICRSPTAHGVFEGLVAQAGLAEQITVDSAGTGAWHAGESPDKRSQAAARARGYNLQHLRARQVLASDFERFDYILAMDAQNLRDLEAMRPASYQGELGLFLDYIAKDSKLERSETEVPDPYYGGARGFEHVLDLVEQASEGLLERIQQA